MPSEETRHASAANQPASTPSSSGGASRSQLSQREVTCQVYPCLAILEHRLWGRDQ